MMNYMSGETVAQKRIFYRNCQLFVFVGFMRFFVRLILSVFEEKPFSIKVGFFFVVKDGID